MEKNIWKKFNRRENEVRQTIMNFVVDEGRSFHIVEDKNAVLHKHGLDKAEYLQVIETLLERDGMVADEGRNVNFVYPVSALPTGHRVTLADGRTFFSMCAIDSIGAAFTFRQDIEVHSACSMCETPVYLKVTNGQITEQVPENPYIITFQLGELVNWAGSC